VLSSNGDPVADLLYSLNWLPMGFAQAYLITGDEAFLERYQRVCEFLVRAQIHSENPAIHGAWTRGLDMDIMEVFGSNSGVGWGPWAIESGWTVAKIAAGLMMGPLFERLKPFYRQSYIANETHRNP